MISILNNKREILSVGNFKCKFARGIKLALGNLYLSTLSAAVDHERLAGVIFNKVNNDNAALLGGAYLDPVHISVIGVNVRVSPSICHKSEGLVLDSSHINLAGRHFKAALFGYLCNTLTTFGCYDDVIAEIGSDINNLSCCCGISVSINISARNNSVIYDSFIFHCYFFGISADCAAARLLAVSFSCCINGYIPFTEGVLSLVTYLTAVTLMPVSSAVIFPFCAEAVLVGINGSVLICKRIC